MNITINSQVLATELRLLNHVVPQKPTLPVLSHVKMTAEDGVVTFYSTDLEVAFRTSCPATVLESGALTVPVQRLLSLVEQLPDTDVQLYTNSSHVHLVSEAFKSRLQTFPVDDFPKLPEVKGALSFLPTAALQAMVAKTRYAVTDKSKYVINGALLSLTDTVTAMITTDGKRLSSITTPRAEGELSATLLPTKVLDALAVLFAGGVLSFSQTERHLFFESGNKLLVSRKLEGQFPSYERIIPRDTNKHAVVVRSQWAAALRRVGVMSEENQATYFDFSEGQLAITSRSAEAGEAFECLPINYRGEPLKVCASWRYVLDFLEAATSETITVDCKEVGTPMLMSEGSSFINVVMLMRG